MKTSRPAADQNLADRVVAHLVEYIRKRRLNSGDEIPSETRLSADLGISRGIVREAYCSLESAGVIDIANGRSPRVGRLNNRAVKQFLKHALLTDQATAEQVFEVRSSIEVRAAELAAGRRTDADVEALSEVVAAMRAAGRQRERFVQADLRFHEAVGRATGNPLFGLLGNALMGSLERTVRAGYDSLRSRAEVDRVVEIHEGIAEAIAARNVSLARRRMESHFDEARQFVVARDVSAKHPKKAAPRRRSAS